MISRIAQNPVTGYLTTFAGCIALGAAIALTHAAADAQQTVEKPAKKRDQVAAPPAEVTQTAPANSRRESKQAKRRAMTLGAQLQAQGNQGLQVSSLEENSLAAQAGFQQNDRIISVDGRGFSNGRQLDAYLASQGGRRVPILIERDGRQMTISVAPGQIGGDTAWLGVFLEEGDAKTKGARITHVYPSGPAARSGLHMGDTITKVNDQPIEHPADLIHFVQESEPQAQTEFHLLRDGQEMNMPVTLGSRSSFVQQANYQNGNGNGAHQQNVGNNHGYVNQNGQLPNAESSHDAFEGVPSHAMQLENDRRNAEQHQRIEQEIRALREEIRQLREELKKK